MKKTLLIIATGLCAMTCAAAGAPMSVKNARPNLVPLKCNQWHLSEVAASLPGNASRAPHKAAAGEPITATPAGKLFENMYVNSSAYGMGFGDVYTQKVDGGLGGVVEGSDGCIYIQAPISQAYIWALGNPWLKCTKAKGDTIVMDTPQPYAIDYGDPYYAYRMKLNSDSSSFVVDSVNTKVRFVWRNDTLTQIDDCLVGLGDAKGEWYYMGDYDIKYTVNPDVVAKIPANTQKLAYKMTYIPKATKLDSTTYMMTSAYVNPSDLQTAYLDHICTDLPNGAVKIELTSKGNTKMPTRQYLGVDKIYNSHVYMLAGNAKVESSSTGSKYFNYDQTEALELATNGESSYTLTAKYPASLIINAGRSNLYIISEYVAPQLTPAEDKAIVPADPVISSVKQLSKCDQLSFVIPTVGVNGEELNVNELYYNVYYNDHAYTFTPDKYQGLDSAMTDIPYSFSDVKFDFYTSKGSTIVYFYDKDWTKIGVQSIYRGGGKENRSKVVYYDKVTGIDATQATAKTVKSVETFDLMGRKTANDANGLVIKRTTYTDGSVRVTKTLAR